MICTLDEKFTWTLDDHSIRGFGRDGSVDEVGQPNRTSTI